MATLRRLLHLVFHLYETTNQNRIKTGGTLSAFVYPAGVQIEAIETVPTSGAGGVVTIACSGRGALQVGDKITVVRLVGAVWIDVSSDSLQTITKIEEQAGADGVFDFEITNTSPTTTFVTAVSDRFVAYKEIANQVTLHEDETDSTDTIAQPFDVPDTGTLDAYIDVRGVDIYVTGDTITDGWYSFNIGVGTGKAALNLKIESLTEAAIMNVDADTSVLRLDTGGTAMVLIEHCTPGRVLVVSPAILGTQLTTINTKADNTIYEAVGRTIDLELNAPVLLLGAEGANSNIAYWTILSTAHVTDLNLDDMGDVGTAGAVAGEPLVYDGAAWGPADTIGSAAAPMAKIYVADNGLIIGAAGFTAEIDTGNLTGPRIYNFPDVAVGTTLLGRQENADISGLKRFLTGAFGFTLGDLTYSRQAQFDMSLITAATLRTYAFPDASGTFALVTDIPTNIADLADVSGTATIGELLWFDGSTWTMTGFIGTHLNPVAELFVDNGHMYIADPLSSFKGRISVDPGLTADHTATAPNETGTMVLQTTHYTDHHFVLPFDALTEGLFYTTATNRNGIFLVDIGSIIGEAYRGMTSMVQCDYSWDLDAASAATTPLQFSVYSRSGKIAVGTTTSPPATSVDELISPILCPGLGLFGSEGQIAGRNAFISGDTLILALTGAGTNHPGVTGTLQLHLTMRAI